VRVPEAAAQTLRVEKRKWDGSVSAVDIAHCLHVPDESWAWFVAAGSRRERPGARSIEVVDSDELWVAVPGERWVLCAYADAALSLTGYKVHASAPFDPPPSGDQIRWIDLDLDFDVFGDTVSLENEAQFHDHARTMGYPDHVVRGAWSGISTIAARYTNGDWPFDGSMQEWVDRPDFRSALAVISVVATHNLAHSRRSGTGLKSAARVISSDITGGGR